MVCLSNSRLQYRNSIRFKAVLHSKQLNISRSLYTQLGGVHGDASESKRVRQGGRKGRGSGRERGGKEIRHLIITGQ